MYAHNQRPFLRYKIINACLTDKRKPYPTIDEIKAVLEPEGLRTVVKDMLNRNLAQYK